MPPIIKHCTNFPPKGGFFFDTGGSIVPAPADLPETFGAAAPLTSVCHVCQVCANTVCQFQICKPLKQKEFIPCVPRVSAFSNLTYYIHT